LKTETGTLPGKLRTIGTALFASGTRDEEALQRMALDRPASAGEWLYAKLVSHALSKTGTRSVD
jgi:hypothetical protein